MNFVAGANFHHNFIHTDDKLLKKGVSLGLLAESKPYTCIEAQTSFWKAGLSP